MMQSPIPNSFWSNAFTGIVATTTAAAVLSMYWEKWSTGREPIAPALKTLRSRGLDYDTATAALRDILDAVDMETRQRRGLVKLALRESSTATTLVKLLKFDADAVEESTTVCSLVFKIVSKAFAPDPDGRDAWHAAGGHKKLLSLVSIAHREGNARLMDEAAQALREVTEVDGSEMSLPIDIPPGSKGALALANFGSTVKMLRIVDKSARTQFLVQITAVFESICTLRTGGIAISAGVDGKSGPSFFLDLIEPRGNQLLTEHCVSAIRWMTIHAPKVHSELAEAANCTKLVDLLEPHQTTPTIHAVMRIVLELVTSSAERQFMTEFFAANGPTALIRLWCKADEKQTRDRAERLVQYINSKPQYTDEIARLLEMHRSMLMERRARDEEAQRKEMMQRRQQQMMQQQMMMQMAQSGQLPPGMMEDE